MQMDYRHFPFKRTVKTVGSKGERGVDLIKAFDTLSNNFVVLYRGFHEKGPTATWALRDR